jgi:hypothetical protein
VNGGRGDGPEPLVSGDLDRAVSWERITALADEYEIRLAFTADDWASSPGWRGRSGRALLELTFAEISGVGYPWIDLRDGELVGILAPGGESWEPIPLNLPEGFDPTGGHWQTESGDRFDTWLAEHPYGH